MLSRNYTAHAPEFTFLHTLTEAFTLHSIPTGNVTFKQIFTDSVTFELCGFKVNSGSARAQVPNFPRAPGANVFSLCC